MLKLYACPQTRATRITWMLEELEVDYEYVKIDLMKGEGRQPAYLKVNPGGKVPALVDGDLLLTESAAICTYLGDKYPAARLVPEPRTATRARYDQWCFFALSELEQPLWTMSKHRFAIPEKWRVPAIMDTAKWELSVALKTLNQGLGEQMFILGDRFCAADILIAHILSWARSSELSLGHDNLDAYADRTLARPALARAKAREMAAAA